ASHAWPCASQSAFGLSLSELGAGEACKGTRRAAKPPSAGRSLNLRPLCGSAGDQLIEPPDADPLVRWCGRGGAARLPPIPIASYYVLAAISWTNMRKGGVWHICSQRIIQTTD